MEVVGAIVLIIALASGVMVLSSNDVDNDASMDLCVGFCLQIDHKMKTVNDPNNPKEATEDEIHDDIHGDAVGEHCVSAGNPMC